MYVNLNRVILNIRFPNFIVTNGCRYVVSLLQLLWSQMQTVIAHGDYMHWCLPSDSHRVAVAFITAYNVDPRTLFEFEFEIGRFVCQWMRVRLAYRG